MYTHCSSHVYNYTQTSYNLKVCGKEQIIHYSHEAV